MSSEPDPSVASLIERLITMPLFASFSPTRPDPDQDPNGSNDPDHELNRIILLNPLTQGMAVIGPGFESIINDITKPGTPPATQASIDGLPRTEVNCRDEIESLGGECVICLEEWKVGDVVNEMPCKHKFHGGCVEKWLKIHGSCPVCRYMMPVDDDGEGKKVGEEEGGGRRRGEVWVTFAFGRSRVETEGLNEES